MQVESHTIEERVIEVVAKQFGLRPSEINRAVRFRQDLGADSLEVTELAMEFEEEFSEGEVDFKIPDEEADKLFTVGQVIDYIEKALKATE
jgi:acyl carrier protein